jgi:LacI family transcriptional regulator
MVKRPTLTDLAKAAGVSIATVDRVINRRLPVSDSTAHRVVRAAESIGYHATSLLKHRVNEAPVRRFGFLLQKRQDAFYRAFGAELVKATTAATEVTGKPFLDYTEELAPRRIVEGLEAMADKCDALAMVAVDHPLVNGAVESLAARGKHVFTLLSDISSTARKSYLAVDSLKAGRTAAWLIARTARQPGKVGILVGSHRYLSQEMSEISFRSYLRQHAPTLQQLEPIVILDDHRIAYEAAVHLLISNPDLVALYATGGGQDGLVQALREEGAGRQIVSVCNELTANTRLALIDGVLDMALGTPSSQIAFRTIECMISACEGKSVPPHILLPADICISENI